MGIMEPLNKLLKDIIILVVVSAVLGIAAQSILPNGIGLFTETTFIGDVKVADVSINPSGEATAASNIELESAYTAFQDTLTIFFDARNPDAYATGHIAQAINLPVFAFMDSLPYLETLDLDTPIITYCDGEDCNASIDLAADLKMMGFSKVNFFFGGWLEWTSAGYPIEEGP